MKENQKGFGLFEWLLALLAICLLVIVSWFVLSQRSGQETNNTPRGQHEAVSVDQPIKDCKDVIDVDVPENWYTYTFNEPGEACYISNVPKGDQIYPSPLTRQDVNIQITKTGADRSKSIDEIINDEIELSKSSGLALTLVSKDQITLFNSDIAMVAVIADDIYGELSTLYYKKDDVLLRAAWKADSELSAQALEVAKTISFKN